MHLRDDLLQTMAAASTIAIGFVSWFLISPLLSVVTGVLLGALLSGVVQSRTQKQVWRKEQSQTNTALIYGPLFREIKSIMNSSRAFGLLSGFAWLSHNQWDQIASDYLYYFIPQGLRNSLDRFFATLSTYNQLSLHINGSLNELILREASQFYKTKVTQIDYYLDYTKDSTMAAAERIPLENLVIYNQHPQGSAG